MANRLVAIYFSLFVSISCASALGWLRAAVRELAASVSVDDAEVLRVLDAALAALRPHLPAAVERGRARGARALALQAPARLGEAEVAVRVVAAR